MGGVFFWVVGCLPLTDGVCEYVLDVVEDIAGETVIELMQEETGIISLSAPSNIPYTVCFK